MSGKLLRRVELVLLIAGSVLLAFFVAAGLHRRILSRVAVDQFKEKEEQQQQQPTPQRAAAPSFWERDFRHDFTLWSQVRIAAYKDSLSQHFEPPLGILRIAKVRLEVPVLEGTDDLSLNRGVGLIEGTARPGEAGNIGIAGHRDGFFRVLRDIGPGDMIELESPDRIDIYRVQQIVIVKPDDVSVLQPSSDSQLTLVTCYPFYFLGSAPERYIVQASLFESGRPPSGGRRQGENSIRSDSALRQSDPQPQKSTKEITQ